MRQRPRIRCHATCKARDTTILPVNLRGGELFGERAEHPLTEIDFPVDVVEVFRPAQEVPEIARETNSIGAKVLWLQAGIVLEKARQITETVGLTVIMIRCLGATHELLGLGPGPHASSVLSERREENQDTVL